MRHLYQEAAKVVKYGGLSEEDAFKTITLNAAKQLGLENRIGSIEVGKDADLAIFNGHPLNSYSRVEMTLVDGEVYFQRDKSMTSVAAAAEAPAKPAPAFTLPIASTGRTRFAVRPYIRSLAHRFLAPPFSSRMAGSREFSSLMNPINW